VKVEEEVHEPEAQRGIIVWFFDNAMAASCRLLECSLRDVWVVVGEATNDIFNIEIFLVLDGLL